MLPVTATQALAGGRAPLGAAGALGLAAFLAGLALESTADIQKFRFKSDPANADKHMGARGLYGLCRHPNYFVSSSTGRRVRRGGRWACPRAAFPAPRRAACPRPQPAAPPARAWPAQGEMVVWAGVCCMAGPAVWRRCPWVLASPALTAILLLFVSGVPLLEAAADARYGSDPAYRRYKEATNLLLPWPPRAA